jgi:DNA replication protein
MQADALKDAEKIYSEDQVEAAFAEAVKRNKRNWKYVEAILRNRKEEEDAKEQTGRDPEKDRRKYVEGKYSDFIEH